MEPLSFLRSWILDLHQIGRPVGEATAREAERVVILAAEAGMPPQAAIALAREVVHSAPPPSTPGWNPLTRL